MEAPAIGDWDRGSAVSVALERKDARIFLVSIIFFKGTFYVMFV